MCSEPVPRVTTNLGASASGNYNNGPSLPENGVQAGVGGEVRSGNSVVKEESIILFLRDAMFNLCEMSINLSDTDIEHKRLVLGKYSEVIDAALTLSGRTEGVLREQNKKRALDRYLDILFQAQRSNSDALELSLKESENLQKQLSEMRYLLDVSLQEIKKDIQTLKPLSE